MNIGYFNYPMPQNEPVLSYAPGTEERKRLKKTLQELKSTSHDIPMFIGGKEIRSGKKKAIHPPHELAHTLGHFHAGDEKHVQQAIEAALKAKDAWEKTPWEDRAAVFLKA